MPKPNAPQMRVLLAAVANGGQLTLPTPGVTIASVRACVHAGWLDEQWVITDAGRDGALAVDPAAYVNTIPDEQIDTELNRVTADVPRPGHGVMVTSGGEPREFQAFWNHTGAPVDKAAWPIVVVVDEGYAVLTDPDTAAETGKAKATMDQIMRAGRDPRVLIIDPKAINRQYPTLAGFEASLAAAVPELEPEAKAIVAASMAGYNLGDLSPAERDAAERGVNPATYRRLHGPITGEIVDGLLPQITDIRDTLVALLTRHGAEDLAVTVAGDPREAGYRLALTTVRRAGLGEMIRLTVFHLELALTAAGNGHRGIATNGLRKAAAYVHAHA